MSAIEAGASILVRFLKSAPHATNVLRTTTKASPEYNAPNTGAGVKSARRDAQGEPMKKRLGTAAALCVVVLGPSVARGETKTWTGAISDSMCGASHAAMRAHGEKVTDRECTVACVSYQTPEAPKYVFVSGGKVYPIANQRFPGLGRRAGDTIMLTGELDDKGAITVSKLEATQKSDSVR